MSTDNMNGTNNGDSVCEEKNGNGVGADVGIAPGLHGDYIDPHLKQRRDYESDYAKLALQGGHQGLLSMSEGDSNGNAKIATLDEFNRRQKGCDNISAYNKIALQGGHKDLLKIEESNGGTPIRSKEKPNNGRTCGDWYGDNKSVADNNNTTSPKKTVKAPTPEPKTTPIRDQRRSHGNCIVPGGEEEPPRVGKKRFNNTSQRQEAPFATNY